MQINGHFIDFTAEELAAIMTESETFRNKVTDYITSPESSILEQFKQIVKSYPKDTMGKIAAIKEIRSLGGKLSLEQLYHAGFSSDIGLKEAKDFVEKIQEEM